ncbi:MAG: hypothetical protein KME06_08880 [Kastovskya adunca ATA6-11-RM4]|jgi:hypothetical protein|nr:hypothetical protein [Kastovskya adunca ATA6-11-RM4]
MREATKTTVAAYATALLSHYGFDRKGYSAQALVNYWLKHYPADWVRLSIIEALYQGRYKAVSVEQILAVWKRRGQPIYRFNHEFERLICRKLPKSFTTPSNTPLAEIDLEEFLPLLTESDPEGTPEDISPQVLVAPQLEEIAPKALVSEAIAETKPESDRPKNPPAVLSDIVLPPPPNSHSEPEPAPEKKAAYEPDWSRHDSSKQPIDQFTPPPDNSGFSLKLKAVVEKQK